MNIIDRGEIGCEERFYGWLVSLGVGEWDDNKECSELMAAFELRGQIDNWIVPDRELFSILCDHLESMAMHRKRGDFGYSKLYISKVGGTWKVETP